MIKMLNNKKTRGCAGSSLDQENSGGEPFPPRPGDRPSAAPGEPSAGRPVPSFLNPRAGLCGPES